MKSAVLVLTVLLVGCVYLENMMSRKPLPDTRIVIYQGQALRVPYNDMDRYRCYDNGPVVAEPYGGGGRTGEWELTCWRTISND